jgi:uncharacterized membrane protein
LFVLFGLFLVAVIPSLVSRATAAASGRGSKNSKPRKADVLECVVCGREGTGKKFCGSCGGDLAPPADVEVSPLVGEGFRSGVQSAGVWLSDPENPTRGWSALLGVAAALLMLTLGNLNLSVLLAGMLIAFLSLVSLSSKSDSKEMVFASLLTGLAGLLLAGCEVLYIKDHFDGGELYRMNSVFKFHYQVWLLLAIASAPMLKFLMENQWPSWAPWKRITWGFLGVFVLVGATLYPILTLVSRTRGTGSQITLDGLAGFKTYNSGDSAAVDWLLKNAHPAGTKVPVVLESWGGSYSSFARIATQTGFPTVLGWDFHEAQWRGSWDKPAIRGGDADDTVMHRRQDVDTIYSTPDVNQAKDILRKYSVDYVVVGNLERTGAGNKAGYPAEGVDKFGQLGLPVFQQGGTAIFKVIR